MKNAKFLIAGTFIIGGLFLTSCQSSKSGCYYGETEIEQPAKSFEKTTYTVQNKIETTE